MTADLRYPTGRFQFPVSATPEGMHEANAALEQLPTDLRNAVAGLDNAQLDTPYRPGGWTLRQVVHHVADSHINAYCRVRRALTEESPHVAPYPEALWAQLPDAVAMPLDPSLAIIDGLHARWTTLNAALDPSQWERTFQHADFPRPLTVWQVAALYAWHGKHHLAHITALRASKWLVTVPPAVAIIALLSLTSAAPLAASMAHEGDRCKPALELEYRATSVLRDRAAFRASSLQLTRYRET